MRKNKVMRFASLVLVLTLLSTCAISGTFAKYVTSSSGTDTARVAKWGVEVTANGDMFAKEYATDDSSFALVATNTVVADEDVVAPGTNGALAGFTITGTPEVATRLTYTADVEVTGKWLSDASTFYFPLTIKVDGKDVPLSTAADASAVEAAIEAAIADVKKDYVAGTNLGDATNGAKKLTVEWAWAFEDASVADKDVKDTYLGNIAATATGTDVPKISIETTCTVTQID